MGSNTVVDALFQEGTSQVRPPYFNGQHFSHWKVRMETYTMSYDIKVWRVIKKENLPIPPRKDKNGQVIISTDPLDLDDFTDEQAAVITVNAKAKNLLYNAINGEEYKKISSCETAKEMWDKLEVTYEGTSKVKETRINLLVREYELFQMKDGESAEAMFFSFSKILGDLKSFGRTIKSGEQDLDKMSYDELRGDLIAFEKTHLHRQIQQEKKKTVAFKATMAEPEDEEENEGGEQDENIAMLSQVVTSMMRKNRNSRKGIPNFRKGRINNENDGRCYECGKHGHIQADCPEQKKKLSRNLQRKKSFGAWSDEEEFDHEEIANMCFMALEDDSNEESGELGSSGNRGINEKEDSDQLGLMADERTSEVRPLNCPNCYEQEFIDIALADIERVLNELRKIQREKKEWALKLEEHRKKNRKGKWYLESVCSRHMTGDKQLSKTVTKLDGGTVTFGDKSKGNVIGVGKVPLSPTCDVDEVYLGYYISSIRSDHGGEFESRAFENFCNDQGISHNFSSPRSPQQNGVVERKNRTLQDMARTMIVENHLPHHFWAEAVSTACHIINRCLIRPILEKTPYELWNESVHVVFVDTNPHPRSEKPPEDEEIPFVTKSVIAGKDHQSESAD
ncbi:PREDICTED: uncharacterized protein LOC109234627 [Nicotiana attenuata]|uniref:uncharacterized protein LOC109234627 n=1 Tax=Nicotiana attenuata TaxID=49451 RepID=UPI000904616F|nr:PREDICTED: uncharacterized protein LOC109234627 [Nicotiana attenuata]